MTANQRLILDSFELNVATATTQGLRDHATEQLAAFRERVAVKLRRDRPSPFARFVEKLENETSPSTARKEPES
jgi:hypothetical protein